MKVIGCVLLIGMCCLFGVTTSAQTQHPLGVNISDNGAFVNIVQHTNRYSKATGYDSLGWPQSDFEMVLADARPATEWAGSIDDPEAYRIDMSGTYQSSFVGKADVTVSGSGAQITKKQYDSQTNTTTFELVVPPPSANHGFLYLTFKNTQRTAQSAVNSGIVQLRVNRPGYALSTTKIFTDEYIRLLTAADFVCYRFYGVQNIWDGEPVFPAVTTWSNRKTPLDACQTEMSGLNGKKDGWSWEYIIALANILKKDIWINIHISCDSDYVANLAKKLKAELDPSIHIYVENSNEVWSPTQAKFGPYNMAQANYYGINFNQNYARRTVELSRWFAAVFGANAINSTIRMVLGAQQSYPGRTDIHLDYINSTFGAPKNYIYGTAPALYFGSTQPSGDTAQINQGMLQDITNQATNASNSSYRKAHIDKAKQWGLPGGALSYEGGSGLPSGGGLTNLANQIMANRTYAMKEIVKKNYLDGWFNIGGGAAMYFILSSGYNRYGCWGITDDYSKPDRNYKMQAIREIIGTPSGVEDNEDVSDDNYSIYPTPTVSEAKIMFNSLTAGSISVSVYSVVGEKISEVKEPIKIGRNIVVIPISGYAPGVYSVVINSGGASIYRSIVISDY